MSDPYQLPTQRFVQPPPLTAAGEAELDAALLACWDEVDPEREDPDGNAERVAQMMQEWFPLLWERVEGALLFEGVTHRLEEFMAALDAENDDDASDGADR